jgi:hypothetical protein
MIRCEPLSPVYMALWGACALSLFGCATPYSKIANSENDNGSFVYSQEGPDAFKVQFLFSEGSMLEHNTGIARILAFRRAAEVAMDKGYSHFSVVDESFELKNSFFSGRQRKCIVKGMYYRTGQVHKEQARTLIDAAAFLKEHTLSKIKRRPSYQPWPADPNDFYSYGKRGGYFLYDGKPRPLSEIAVLFDGNGVSIANIDGVKFERDMNTIGMLPEQQRIEMLPGTYTINLSLYRNISRSHYVSAKQSMPITVKAGMTYGIVAEVEKGKISSNQEVPVMFKLIELP